MTTHDPAPWAMYWNHDDELLIITDPEDCDNQVICVMDQLPDGERTDADAERVLANARLIIAAPKLAEALLRLLKASHPFYQDTIRKEGKDALQSDVRAAVEALEAAGVIGDDHGRPPTVANPRGCRQCKSWCGVPGCDICNGARLCYRCRQERGES